MSDRFLDSYSGETTDALLALQGQYRIDSLVLAFEQAIQSKAGGDRSDEESNILAVEALEREVNNGGYWQFFVNSSNEFVPIVDRALRAINCPKTAAITRDAIAALGLTGSLDPQRVAEAAERDGARKTFAQCDDRYFSNDEPIADRLFEWIKANKGAIRIGNA